jgi:hypothetical protein
MLVLAKFLQARVRGDEWETYDSDKTFLHPDDVSLREEAEAKSNAFLARELKHQKVFRNAIVGFFVALAAIFFLFGKWLEKL